MKYLKDKGLANPKEFEQYLGEAKKEGKKLNNDSDFAMLMKHF